MSNSNVTYCWIQNLGTSRSLSSNTTTPLTFASSPQVVGQTYDGSASQIWALVGDTITATEQILTALDLNFGLTCLNSSSIKPCGITNVHYYDVMPNSPSKPAVTFKWLSREIYNIILTGTNLYLCDDATNGVYWKPVNGDATDNNLEWGIVALNSFDGSSLIMPQNMNQKYANYNGALDSACMACCFADIVSYYTDAPYTYSDMLKDGVMVSGSPYLQKYTLNNVAKIVSAGTDTVGSQQNSFIGMVKTQIDSGKPLLLRIGTTDSHSKHSVVAYGYYGRFLSPDTIFVLDPANSNHTNIDVGRYSTLQESYTWNDCNMINEIFESVKL